MEYLLKNARVFVDGALHLADVFIRDGRIISISQGLEAPASAVSIDLHNAAVFPGFVDVHVHLREPGFSYKETIRTGTLAAARGGFAHVCPMPNLNPVPDSREHLEEQLEIIRRDAVVHVHPYGAITRGERGETLADLEAMAPDAAGFSDDGRGVQSPELMRSAMAEAKRLDKIIAAHCEDNSLLRGGYIHDGAYAREHGHRGICSESEWGQIARDLELAAETGVKYHVCHVSTKESVQVVREAKARGVDVTCEVGPHYLVYCDEDLQEDGRFKMNPPLRSREDRAALIQGVQDGTIDMIATDHAPHSAEEKAKPLTEAPSGILGLETSLALGITELVDKGFLTLPQLMRKMSLNPARLYRLDCGRLETGAPADLVLFDPEEEWTVEGFHSKSSNSPFLGWKLKGRVHATICGGKIVYSLG